MKLSVKGEVMCKVGVLRIATLCAIEAFITAKKFGF